MIMTVTAGCYTGPLFKVNDRCAENSPIRFIRQGHPSVTVQFSMGAHSPAVRAYVFLTGTSLCWGINAVLAQMAVDEVSPMPVGESALGGDARPVIGCFLEIDLQGLADIEGKSASAVSDGRTGLHRL